MAEEVENVAESICEMVREYRGKENRVVMELIKAMNEKCGEENCDKKLGKTATRLLIDGGRCTYSHVGGSYVVLNPDLKA